MASSHGASSFPAWSAARLVTGLLLVLCCQGGAVAGDWQITPRIAAKETFTDNLFLTPGNEKSGFITELNPGISVHGRGARVNLNLDYTMQNVIYDRTRVDDQTNQQLQARGDVELVKQMVFLEGGASIRQENSDNRGRVALDNLSVSDNRRDVVTYRLSPIIRHHFGAYADAEARFIYDVVDNDGGDGRSESTGVQGRLVGGRRFQTLRWQLNYLDRTIDNESGDDTEFSEITGTATYALRRGLDVFATLGYEDNELNTTAIDNSGRVTRLGFNWAPSSRTALTLGLEDRPRGDNAFFSLEHQRRRTVLSASYTETTTTSRDLQLERVLIPLVDEFGEFIVDDRGEIVGIPVDQVRQANRVIINKRFTSAVAMRGRRTDYRLGIFNDQRSSRAGDDEEVIGLTASVNHRLSRRLRGSLSGSWRRTEFDLSGDEDTVWNVGLRLSYRIFERVSGNIDLRHVNNDDATPANSYEENRLSAGLTVEF